MVAGLAVFALSLRGFERPSLARVLGLVFLRGARVGLASVFSVAGLLAVGRLAGAACSDFILKPIRLRLASTEITRTLTMSPGLTRFMGSSTKSLAISEMCTNPS